VPDERQGIWNEAVVAEQKKCPNIFLGIMKKAAEKFIRVACAMESFRNVHFLNSNSGAL
jgi:hypothetical protein